MAAPPARPSVTLERAESTYPLRLAVLRAGHGPESAAFPGDDHPLAAHATARRAPPETVSGTDGGVDGGMGEVVAVGTVFPDAPPWEPGRADAWRIRGMATRADARSQGYGRAVLDVLLAHAVAHGGVVVWCHARVGALEFYRRAGFGEVGELFDDGFGPHRSMSRPLTGTDLPAPGEEPPGR